MKRFLIIPLLILSFCAFSQDPWDHKGLHRTDSAYGKHTVEGDTANIKPIGQHITTGKYYRLSYWPGSGGTAVTPGGSNGNLQYNNSSAFGGASQINVIGSGTQLKFGTATPFDATTSRLFTTNAFDGVSNEVNGNGYARTWYYDASRATDKKVWEVLNYSDQFMISRVNDANSSRTTHLLLDDAGVALPNGYLNFTTTMGSSGYGIRNNGGTIEVKNNGGSWGPIGTGGGSIASTTNLLKGDGSGNAVAATPGTDYATASGIHYEQAVKYATTAALAANTYNNGTSGVGATLTGNANGAISIDGSTPSVGDRVLVKNESAQANNGIYTVTTVGSGGAAYVLTRATDFDQSAEISEGDAVFVTVGSANSGTSWYQQTSGTITIGTTAVVFVQFNNVAGLADPGSNGIVVRTATNSTTARSIIGTSGKIVVSNQDGTGGNPTINAGSDIVDKTAATTYTAGAKQTFTASGTTAGINIAGVSSDPSSPANGDMWLSTADNTMKGRMGGATKTFVTLEGDQTFTGDNITFNNNITVSGNVTASNVLSSVNVITESTVPGTPAAGKQSFYINSTDHLPHYVNSSGTDVAWNGLLLNVRVLTSGTSYTPTSGTKMVRIRMVGAGGGGGGASGANSSVGAAAGGGSGGYLEKWIFNVSGSYTYSIGTAGTAGANTGGTGGNGGNTTFVNGGTTYTAFGGVGGLGQTAGTALAITVGGDGGAVSTNGDVNSGGSPGANGIRLSGTVGVSGGGAGSQFGGGGKPLNAAGAGVDGSGYGSGGGGALSTANTNRAGGAGKQGVIIIEEFR